MTYVIEFTSPEGDRLFADWNERKRRWFFVAKEISARQFGNELVAERVARNVPPFKQKVAEGYSWAVRS